MPVTSFKRRFRVGVSASSSGFIRDTRGLPSARVPGPAAKSERQSGFIIPEMGRGKPKTAPPPYAGNRFRDSPTFSSPRDHWVIGFLVGAPCFSRGSWTLVQWKSLAEKNGL